MGGLIVRAKQDQDLKNDYTSVNFEEKDFWKYIDKSKKKIAT